MRCVMFIIQNIFAIKQYVICYLLAQLSPVCYCNFSNSVDLNEVVYSFAR